MAGRGRKKKPSAAEELGLLFLGGCYAVWNYMKENPLETMLIGLVVFLLLAWALTARRRKWAKYIKWFYNRERRIQELEPHMIDEELTSAIIEAYEDGDTISLGKTRLDLFAKLRRAYAGLASSDDVMRGEQHDLITLSDKGISISEKNGIKALCDPVAIRCIGERDSGYVFYLFPETILTFFEGPEKTVFLLALKPEAMEVFTEDDSVIKGVVVHEKSQREIRYYDKFSPVPDADIIDSRWKTTNKDGSRSFKGGLKPENNPLFFELRYVRMYARVGKYTAMAAFSNSSATHDFEEAFDNYKWEDMPYIPLKEETVTDKTANSVSVEEEKPDGSFDDTFLRTNANLKDDVQTDAVEAVPAPKEIPQVIQSGISSASETSIDSPIENNDSEELTSDNTDSEVESIRYRNREVAKSAVNRLNAKYSGIYEFKVYQVRKPRDGWGLQDAGVYTYSTDDQGNQYTIEFDLISNLESKKTELRFSIWGKTRELVADRYKTTVTKGKMNISGEGYGLIIHRDYESMNQTEMTTQFEKDTLTLMKLIEMDVPAK